MTLLNFLEEIEHKFFHKPYYYIYWMSLYHVLVILVKLIFPYIPSHVMYQLTYSPDAVNTLSGYNSLYGIIWNYIMILLIFLLDIIFIFIIVMEFKPKWFNIKRLVIIESAILTTSLLFPYFRDVMIFLSINTLIITILYKLVKFENDITRIGIIKHCFIIGTIIYIVKLSGWFLLMCYMVLSGCFECIG